MMIYVTWLISLPLFCFPQCLLVPILILRWLPIASVFLSSGKKRMNFLSPAKTSRFTLIGCVWSHAPLDKSLWPGERMNWIVEPKTQLEVESAFSDPHGSPNRFWVDKEVHREKRKLRRPLSKDHDNRWERDAILIWKAAGARCSKAFSFEN